MIIDVLGHSIDPKTNLFFYSKHRAFKAVAKKDSKKNPKKKCCGARVTQVIES